jgi:hypothetical protein
MVHETLFRAGEVLNVLRSRKGVSDLLEYVTATLATPYDQRGEPDFK